MDLDLLRSFVAVCDTKSFTAAARQVGRTQSAVSLQVRRLEAALGRPLFLRGTAGPELTEHGVLLLAHARDILARVGDALSAFGRGTAEGVVVLGLPDDYAPRILPKLLHGFFALHPQATVDIVLDESRTLVRRLAEGSVDLAFITDGEGPVRGGPVAFRDRLVWAAPSEGDLHRRDPLPVALWDENDTYALTLAEALRGIGRAYRPVILSRNMTGLRTAVTSGLAVTIMVGSSLGEGMRELGPEDGFPVLREFAIRLEKAHQRRSPLLDRLAGHLLKALAAQEPPPSPLR